MVLFLAKATTILLRRYSRNVEPLQLSTGPWSWGGYSLKRVLTYGLARIPMISSTGNWASPLVSSKGYSLNTNVDDEKLPVIRDVLEVLDKCRNASGDGTTDFYHSYHYFCAMLTLLSRKILS